MILQIRYLHRFCWFVATIGFAIGCTKYTGGIEPVLVDRSESEKVIDFGKVKLAYLLRLERLSKGKGTPDDLNVFTPGDAKLVFNLFCRGGKPIRGIKDSVTYVQLRPPAGLPLDAARKIEEQQNQRMNRAIATFYSRLAGPIKLLRNRLIGRSAEAQSAYQLPGGYPLVLKSEEAADESKTSFLRRLFSPPAPISARDLIENLKEMRAAEGGGSFQPLFVRSASTAGTSWVASTIEPKSFYKSGKVSLNTGVQTRGDVPPYNLTEMTPVELLGIAERYILTVSPAERLSWHQVADARRSANLKISLPLQPEIGSPLPQSTLLAERATILEDYLIANTSIMESTTDDGQVFAFTLSLNTEPLCRLAHLADTLYSK